LTKLKNSKRSDQNLSKVRNLYYIFGLDIADEDLDLIDLDFGVEEQLRCVPFTLGALDRTYSHVSILKV
jgi:hypothetical protein